MQKSGLDTEGNGEEKKVCKVLKWKEPKRTEFSTQCYH